MLMIVSVMVVYSSTGRLAFNRHAGNTLFYLGRQLGLLVGCFGILFVVQALRWRWFYRNAKFLLVIAAGLLLWAALGGENINGAGRWIRIFGISFQPSEFAKIAIIIYTARLLSDHRAEKGCRDEVLKKFLIPAAVIGLIFLDNFSTSALISMVCLLLLWIGGVRSKLLVSVFGGMVVLLALVLMFGILVPQVQEWGRIGTIVGRLTAFVVKSDEDDAGQRDYNYQSEQAKIAVAEGGLLGCGPGNSVQRNFLPHAYSDFIYAIIIEEYGLGGGGFILLLYAVILFRTGVMGRRCLKYGSGSSQGPPEIFPALLVIGLGLSIVLQAMFHMGVNVGALPVTGQTLPLVSMGGTSLWFTSVAFGIMLGTAHYFSPEGQAEEAERMEMKRRKGGYWGNWDKTEGADEEETECFDGGELPEAKVGISAGGKRRGRRSESISEESADGGEEDGWTELENLQEDEEENGMEGARRRGKRGADFQKR